MSFLRMIDDYEYYFHRKKMWEMEYFLKVKGK